MVRVIVTLGAAHCMDSHVLITSTMGNFAVWFAGRLTCDSNKVSNSQDFEDKLHNHGHHIL